MRFILLFIALIGLVVVGYDITHPADPAKANQAEAIGRSLADKWTPGAYRDHLRLARSGQNLLEMTLDYQVLPAGSFITAEFDTTSVARAIIAALISAGRDPRSEGINIRVDAKQIGLKGETGADLIRPLGYAYYDHNTDSILYVVPKN